jgi:hypothetical protein
MAFVLDTSKGHARKRKPLATLTTAQYERLTVIQQVKRAFGAGARLAGFVGLVIGGFVPVATYTLVHREVSRYPVLWILVAGGLLYSATTVYLWARAAFGSTVKSLGFVILLEGILTFSHITALGLSALTVLVFINAVSAACALQVRKT